MILSGVIIKVMISPTIFAVKNNVLIDKLSCTGNDVSIKDSHKKGITANKPNPIIF